MDNARGEAYSQTMWPEHCVIGTKGAEIDKTLRGSFGPWKDKMRIVRKVGVLQPRPDYFPAPDWLIPGRHGRESNEMPSICCERAHGQGWHSGIEAYSAFEGYITAPTDPDDEPPKDTPPALAPRDTELARLLRSKGAEEVVVTGLATDYW